MVQYSIEDGSNKIKETIEKNKERTDEIIEAGRNALNYDKVIENMIERGLLSEIDMEVLKAKGVIVNDKVVQKADKNIEQTPKEQEQEEER